MRLGFALLFVSAVWGGSPPRHAVLVPGSSLAGIRLGDTPAAVRAHLGSGYRTCTRCGERTWYYMSERSSGEPFGLGVSFRAGRASAIFTLGAPSGWRTPMGLRLGDSVEHVYALYHGLSLSACIGYVALSMRRVGSVTSIYATGDSVYGFALTRPMESVCR